MKLENYFIMENKYYTPSIEEFHIGFECEMLSEIYGGTAVPIEQHKEIWRKYTLNRQDIIRFFIQTDELARPLFRVKYLDKENVESLGFEQQSLPYQFKKDWYRLIKRHEENQYIIEDDRHQDQIFVGGYKEQIRT